MILTVTPNTALDHSLIVPEFRANATIRCLESVVSMAGKAADVSWMLAKWGVPSLAMGFAAGANGQRMDAMLREIGVQTDFTWVDGETRLNTVVVTADGCVHTTFTTATLKVTDDHLADFEARFQKALPQATCLVLGGTAASGAPVTFYRDLIARGRERGIPTLMDCTGVLQRAGLEAGPTLIKPNLAELEELTGQKAHDRQTVYDLARQVQAKYGVSLIVTLGREGAFALFGEASYWIPPLSVKVVNPAGAGDAVVAGMTLALARGDRIEDGLRLGFALAAATVQHPATADYHRQDAEKFLSQVQVQRL